jgi:cytochrome c5
MTVTQPAQRCFVHILKFFVLGSILVAPLSFAEVPPGTDAEIRERLKPAGSLCRVGEDCGTAAAVAATGPLTGQQVYDKFCFACHAAGVSGAPIFGNADQWKPRVAKGMDELMKSTLNGLNAMPAKGTCVTCADEELKGAVQYMLDGNAG